jgi:hypothetical protein
MVYRFLVTVTAFLFRVNNYDQEVLTLTREMRHHTCVSPVQV